MIISVQLLTVIATVLERNPELEIEQCIDLDEVKQIYYFCPLLNLLFLLLKVSCFSYSVALVSICSH